jgi:hypothetical protein
VADDQFVLRVDQSGQIMGPLPATPAAASPPPVPQGDADSAQIDAYLDSLYARMREFRDEAGRKALGEQLAALGKPGLKRVLERLPLESHEVQTSVRESILPALVTRDDLPILREALRQDLRLVSVFVAKGWQADARDIVLARLPDRRLPLPVAALAIAAEAKDPLTYGDLAWHVVHRHEACGALLPALDACPGFPVADTLRAAWRRALIGKASIGDLIGPAAAEGLPGALDAVIEGLAEAECLSGTLPGFLAALGKVVDYAGPADATFARWLVAHRGQFAFDPERRRYHLAQP